MSTRSSTKPAAAKARAVSVGAATAVDDRWMQHALALARNGVALAHSNPMVGALLLKGGRIIGQGFHVYETLRHAEILALEQAGMAARGATLYVTLEPCCHLGRTGPCTRAVIAAGVKRIVVAMADPNPRVAGRGLRELRRAGVQVVTGVCEPEAQRLNEAFARWIRTGLPFVTLKTAATLDGHIASRDGSTTWITSPQAREEVQELRHAADAILTGIGTVLTDDPRMTDRTGRPRRRPLLRAIVDSRLRLPLRSKLVRDADHDLLVFTTLPLDSPRAKRLQRAGAEIVRVPARGGHADVSEVARELGRRQILSVLLEAGATLNGAALAAGIVDKMIIFYAPRVMGADNVPMASFPKRADHVAPLTNLRLHQVGPDFVVEGYFRNVYGSNSSRRKD